MVTVYRSTDTSAPTLSGTVGDLINLLDKCLVAGYGSKAAAGWTKPFTGTNTAVFRQGGGNQLYLDVNDNGPGAAGAQEARIKGYEAMTAVATGTNPFPTVAQLATGLFVRKSAAVSATVRTWTLIADDRTFYLLIQTGDTAGNWYCTVFGDFYSYVSGTDNYRTMIIGRIVENSSATATERSDVLATGTSVGAVTGHFAARAFTGLGGSTTLAKFGDYAKASGVAILAGNMATPSPVDGNIWLAPIFIADAATSPTRGKMRGFMHYLHAILGVADQDTITGAGSYVGHTFLVFKQGPNAGVYVIDITGPWDTN